MTLVVFAILANTPVFGDQKISTGVILDYCTMSIEHESKELFKLDFCGDRLKITGSLKPDKAAQVFLDALEEQFELRYRGKDKELAECRESLNEIVSRVEKLLEHFSESPEAKEPEAKAPLSSGTCTLGENQIVCGELIFPVHGDPAIDGFNNCCMCPGACNNGFCTLACCACE